MQESSINSESYFPQLREYRPRAFGTWAIFPQLREVSLTIDLDASHYLHTIGQLWQRSRIAVTEYRSERRLCDRPGTHMSIPAFHIRSLPGVSTPAFSTSPGGTHVACPRSRGISSPSGTKFDHMKLETLRYRMVEINPESLYYLGLNRYRVVTDGRTELR